MPRAPLAAPLTALAALAACVSCALVGLEPTSPLVGRIWQVDAGRFVAEEELLRALAEPRYVLLGEVHVNPEQHRIQARVIDALVAEGRRPAVVLEMVSRDHGEALERVQRRPDLRARDVRRAVEWDASGWPAWKLYAPVFEAALEGGLPLAAGDLAQADREALRRAGAEGLDDDVTARLGLASEAPPAHREVLVRAIRRGHCELLPEDAVPAMVDFQRARDAQLARSLVEAATPDGAVLIAGSGHVRNDVAVPHWLGRFDRGAAVASVGLWETDPGDSDAARLLAGRYGESAPYDYVWFTRRTRRPDPCEPLRQRFPGPEEP